MQKQKCAVEIHYSTRSLGNKQKMRSRDPLLNKIIGKYTKNDINENG